MIPHTQTLDAGLAPLPLLADPPAPAPVLPGVITYYKRFKMEADLVGCTPADPPPGFTLHPWTPALLERHAATLFASFHGEIDSHVFASLGDREGCRNLMTSIVQKSGFLPGATWLLTCAGDPAGTVQGIRERRGLGAIQNLGIVPRYRGHGLGTLLMAHALFGFVQAGLSRASLEVTARNERALQLYARLGFRRVKTVYKAVPACFSPPGP